ncbi:MAG: hypothetical protein OJF50_006279 [Nitrospira sp.]|jgi:hypothetical protein|nr:hypothetical protein [Nitrospira sp.]
MITNKKRWEYCVVSLANPDYPCVLIEDGWQLALVEQPSLEDGWLMIFKRQALPGSLAEPCKQLRSHISNKKRSQL